jgi:ABC-type bacteriocin/lantibiotic exporter with double-glycine peptidase domain
VVTYHIVPASFLGRLLAFVMATIILVVAFSLSIMIFWILATLVLFFMVFAWLASRRTRRQQGKIIDIENEDRGSEASQSDRPSRQ